MSKLTAFFKQNKKEATTFDIYLESFEEPITLKVISGADNKRIQKESMVERKQGRQTKKEMDGAAYNEKLAIASIVNPPLSNTEIQESYGVMGEAELYNEMFNWAEQTLIVEAILEESGFNQDINEKIAKAKN